MQKYGTDPELDKLVDSNNHDVRRKAAKQGYGLDKLVNDKSKWVRYEVANQGYGLNKLINDKDGTVRGAVSYYLKDHGYKSVFDWAKDNNVDLDIDEWLHSDDWPQRKQLAIAGYHLDILINDEDWHVREELAEQGYSLDKLVKDRNPLVRR